MNRTVCIILILALLGIVLYTILYLQARVIHIEYAELFLPDLPEAFEGTRVLYMSDIHVTSQADAKRLTALIPQLNDLHPDLVLLGGDYSDVRLWNSILCFGNEAASQSKLENVYAISHEWMAELNALNAPLGKFAVQGNHDIDDGELGTALAQGGFRLLMNETASVTKDGDTLIIAGTADFSGDVHPEKIAAQVTADDCVILLSHQPDLLPRVYTTEASGGGTWADLSLCGHTHGGQIRIGNFVPINKSGYGLRYISGWGSEMGGKYLVSNGVGMSGLPIRLGANAQIHLITLHKEP